jgi:Mrp family chromosome partitioning ATPase
MTTLTQAAAAASSQRGGTGGAIAEQYYALANWLRPSGEAEAFGESAIAPKSIGVTSCIHGAGTSTVAANLAIAAATTGNLPVVLVDLSGHPSRIARQFSLSGDLGLEAALQSDLPPAACAKATPIENLSLLALGERSRLSSFDGNRIVDLLRQLERDFAFLVIDLPPTDSGLCFSTVGTLNGVLLVMDGQRTQGQAALRAKQRLIHANAAVLGVILNNHAHDLPQWLHARI